MDEPSGDWLGGLPAGKVPYADHWGHLPHTGPPLTPEDQALSDAETTTPDSRTVAAPRVWRCGGVRSIRRLLRDEQGCLPLGALARVRLGVQTSCDPVFLLESADQPGTGTSVRAWSSHGGGTVEVERAGVMAYAKGSTHLEPFRLKRRPDWLVWPYDEQGELLSQERLQADLPLTWRYLQQCRDRLRARESGRLDRGGWWCFRRPQGLGVARRANKILVPSIMRPATAYLDRDGNLAFPGSGTGGGGAWAIELYRDESRVSIRWLLAVLNSEPYWDWLRWEGDRKKGGWRGVDRSILLRVPVPLPASQEVRERAERLTEEIESLPCGPETTRRQDEINRIVRQVPPPGAWPRRLPGSR